MPWKQERNDYATNLWSSLHCSVCSPTISMLQPETRFWIRKSELALTDKKWKTIRFQIQRAEVKSLEGKLLARPWQKSFSTSILRKNFREDWMQNGSYIHPLGEREGSPKIGTYESFGLRADGSNGVIYSTTQLYNQFCNYDVISDRTQPTVETTRWMNSNVTGQVKDAK